MPWECRECNTHVPNDSVTVCPRCNTDKASWTLAADRTRNFVVTARKYDLLLGDGRISPAVITDVNGTRAAERAVSVPKDKALQWHKAKKLPPGELLLLVRMWVAEKETKASLRLTVEWATKEAAALPDYEFTAIKTVKRNVGGAIKFSFDARILFVHGADAWPKDAKFDGIEVVDVTDADGNGGHAPRVGVQPFKQGKRIALPLDAYEKGWVQRLQCYELEFNHESHLLRPEGMDVVFEVLKRCSMHDYKNMRLLVTGHTDSSGDEKTINLPLATRRCQNLVHMLEGSRTEWAKSSLNNITNLPEAKAKLDKKMIESKWGKGTFAGFKARYKVKFPASTTSVGDSWESQSAWLAAYDFYEEELIGRMGELVLGAEALKRLKDLDMAANGLKLAVADLEKQKTETTDATKLAQVKKDLAAKKDELTKKEAELKKARKEELDKARADSEQKRRDYLAKLRAAIQWVDTERKYVACGERYLKVRTGSNEREELNRRDEFLWFPVDRPPWKATAKPADETAAQEAVYGAETQAEWDYNTNDGPFSFDQLDCPAKPLIEVPPDDAVFVIDRSGSMAANLPPSDPPKVPARPIISRITACRRELQRVMRRLSFEQKFAIVYFDHVVDTWGDGVMAKADDTRIDDACDWAASLVERGATATLGALEAALAVEGVERILFLSDGLPTVGVLNEKVILDKVRARIAAIEAAKKVKVKIDTYGFLAIPEPEDEAALKRYKAEREAVGKAYLKELEKHPESVVATDPQAVRDAWGKRYENVATWLNVRTNNTVPPYSGTAFSVNGVTNALLGWFLWQLSEDTGGTFHDLTAKFT